MLFIFQNLSQIHLCDVILYKYLILDAFIGHIALILGLEKRECRISACLNSYQMYFMLCLTVKSVLSICF